MNELSHLDEKGRARMVDVSAKDVTRRRAVARGTVRMEADTLSRILEGQLPKGDVLAVARTAGIMAAKRTADLIPLCHPLPIDSVEIVFAPAGKDALPSAPVDQFISQPQGGPSLPPITMLRSAAAISFSCSTPPCFVSHQSRTACAIGSIPFSFHHRSSFPTLCRAL